MRDMEIFRVHRKTSGQQQLSSESLCVCVCVSEHTSIRYNLNLERMVMEIKKLGVKTLLHLRFRVTLLEGAGPGLSAYQ